MNFLDGAGQTIPDEVIAYRGPPYGDIGFPIVAIVPGNRDVSLKTKVNCLYGLTRRTGQDEPCAGRRTIHGEVVSLIAIEIAVDRNIAGKAKLSYADGARTAV